MIRFNGTVQLLGVLNSRKSMDGKSVFYRIAALASRRHDQLAPSTGEPFDCYSIGVKLSAEAVPSEIFKTGQVCYVSGTVRTFVGTKNGQLQVIHNLDTDSGEFTPLHTIPLQIDVAAHLSEFGSNNKGQR